MLILILDNKFCDKKLFFPFNFTFPLVLQTRFDDVERGMPSLPLDNTHDRSTLSMASHHGPLAHTQSDIWHGSAIIALGMHTWSDDIRRGVSSLPLKSIHDGTTSVMACY